MPPPEDGPLPQAVTLAQKNDTEALLAFGNGSGVVVRLDTGCITEGWAFSSVPEPEPASFEPDHLSRLTVVFDDPKHALQVPTPLRAAYQAWLAPRIAEAARFAHPQSAYPASFSADQRTVLLNVGDRAFLSHDRGQTFSPVLREPNALDERLDSADLVADQYLLIFDRSGDRYLVRTLGGPSPGTPLAWKATGPDMETDAGRVGTVMHLLQISAFNRAESTAPTKVCTRAIDLAAPTAPAKKGVCFALPGQQALRATSEKYPWSAFAEIERVSRITRAVTLVNLVKKTHKRYVLESSARPGSLHVDPTGQIAWTGEDGRSRTIGLDGKTRVLEGSGVVAGWAPPTSKHGILLVDAHPEGGSLRDHRCSLLRALPR